MFVSWNLLPTATAANTSTITSSTIIVIVKEKEPSCYKIQTIYIKQDKTIFENWRCECTNQDLNYWGRWHLLISLAIYLKQINLIILA